MAKAISPAVSPNNPAAVPRIASPKRHTRIASAKSRLGSTKPQMPATLTIISAAGEMKPASTAAVPTTMPPTVDTDCPMA